MAGNGMSVRAVLVALSIALRSLNAAAVRKFML